MVTSCAWNPAQASILASGSADSTRIWDVAHGSFKVLNCPSGALDNLSNAISQLVWNPDGTLLATASHTAKANIWSITGDVKHSIDGHQGSIIMLGFFWATLWPANGMSTGYFKMFICYTLSSAIDCASSIFPVLFQRGEELCAAKWNTEGSLLAAGFNFGKHSNVILDIGWSPNSTSLASGSADQSLKLWNIEYGKEVTSLYHPRASKSISFEPHGLYILTVSSKILSVVFVKGGKVMKTFEAEGEVCQASWNNDGSKIAVCSED
ncbi:hypothetical protein C5167_005572 [Papaver somniferum]|uniref:Anaphase-promoting complex subunit 4-like WD40 domain-containing protein n=1 Tax=Papaver somniferum TaxID=3469 RepID=A0A4Y7JAX4_PAPSO|nr:hypothetical protein C5167_005572 [Papaver somniferum]